MYFRDIKLILAELLQIQAWHTISTANSLYDTPLSIKQLWWKITTTSPNSNNYIEECVQTDVSIAVDIQF